MHVRRISIACLGLLATAGCDLPAGDANLQADAPPSPSRVDRGLKLEPGGNETAAPTCGPGAVIREPYPCSGPCLQSPGVPAPINCIRSMRTCYRTRPAPPCPGRPARTPADAPPPAKGGA